MTTSAPPGWAPDPPMVGIRSPIGLVVGSCTSHPGVLGSFPNERNQGKQAHPVLKYRVPHRYVLLRSVPLSVLQLSRPAGPAAPEVRHPFPTPCHGAAHQALGALQGPASALRRHAFRGAAPASPPPEIQGHGPRLDPARGDEQPRRAGRQRQGTRALLEAHGMARRHQAHLSQ